MRHLWCMLLVAALASGALGRSSGVATPLARLRARRPLEADELPDSRGANKSVAAFSRAPGHGDLTCMQWTGGMCPFTYCKEERGPTVCVDSKCMCQPGYCANALGECEEHIGQFIGSFAMAFEHAYMLHMPYIGAEPPTPTWQENYLVATDDSEPQWNIVVSPRAHVRFESKRYPGNILTIYQNRRRRSFLVQTATKHGHPGTPTKSENDTAGVDAGDVENAYWKSGRADRGGNVITENEEEDLHEWGALRSTRGERVTVDESVDLIPVLMPFEQAHPIQATFRVRPTDDDGGGYEVWSPQSRVVLSSADPNLMFVDPAAARGLGDCSALAGNCEGHQLVVFRPPLPDWVTPSAERKSINPHGPLHWWQIALFYLCIVLCIRFCYFESWQACCFLSAVVVVATVIFIVALVFALVGFQVMCGAFCKRNQLFGLLASMVIMIAVIALYVYLAIRGSEWYFRSGLYLPPDWDCIGERDPEQREEERRRREVAAALEVRREEAATEEGRREEGGQDPPTEEGRREEGGQDPPPPPPPAER